AAAGADSFADADFAGSLGDADQHDVHNPNSANNKRNTGDRTEQQRERASNLVERVQKVLLALDAEIILHDLMSSPQQIANLGDGVVHDAFAHDLHVDRADVG